MVLLFVMSDHAWQCIHRNYPSWQVAVTLLPFLSQRGLAFTGFIIEMY